MEQRITFYFAEIDPDTNMCISVEASSNNDNGENWVPIPVYDENYLMTYYNWDNGKFYYDPEYTQEFVSDLL